MSDVPYACTFCEIVDHREPADILYEDDEVIVFRNRLKWVPVMLLAVPKAHKTQAQLWQNLGRVGEMRQSCFVHDDAGFAEPLLKFLAQCLRHFVDVAAQRALLILAVVISVKARQVAQRRLALRDDIVLVVVDIEQCLRGVVDAPDHNRGDLDRVPTFVVHLQRLAVERPCA